MFNLWCIVVRAMFSIAFSANVGEIGAHPTKPLVLESSNGGEAMQ